jgi:Ni,Fe-hydrogenase III large subunit
MQEQVMQLNEYLTGSRLLRGVNCIGGVKIDVSPEEFVKIKELLTTLKGEMDDYVNLVTNLPSLLDRTQTTGILSNTVARDLNLVGPVARASGIDRDVRRDHPYAAYSLLTFKVITQQSGDVQGRFLVKIGEIYESINIIEQAHAKMPSGPIKVDIANVPPNKIGFSHVETPRGEAVHWIYSGEGKPYRHKIRDPSFCNWLAMESAVVGGKGNIVPDFPLINKSMNLSYSGNDL